MKSKDIIEAPGDGRGRAAGSAKTQYKKDGTPGAGRVAKSNNQFRSVPKGTNDPRGSSNPMNPLGDGGRKNDAGQATKFKRADQQINQKFGNDDSLAGGSSRIQQFKKDKEEKARMQKSQTRGDVGRFAQDRALWQPGKVIQHPNGLMYQLISKKDGWIEVTGPTVNKTTGVISKLDLAKPTPGGKAAPMDSALGKDLNTLLKDPKANIDQSVTDKVKGALQKGVAGAASKMGMSNLASKTRSDPDASTSKKVGATVGAGIGRAMANVLRRPKGQPAPDKKQMSNVGQLDMKAFQSMIMKSQDPAQKLQMATDMLDKMAVQKSRNVSVEPYLDSLGPMLKASGLQKTNPQEYQALVTKARGMREAAYNYFNKLIETVGITWEQLGYKVVLSENKGDDIILIPTKEIELNQLKALAGV